MATRRAKGADTGHGVYFDTHTEHRIREERAVLLRELGAGEAGSYTNPRGLCDHPNAVLRELIEVPHRHRNTAG